ncbi:hypothetical protein P3TCK_12206 [Photobacterium profundum 3TCK]|uniref:Uncharacterized protein n=1 Tax=Photobacterium profundum 3TCK TaxID=314280 RepID=Q1Z696_9GAMM|nr:hypothetical protein P3TCK_12206 [Photobacterium profundum 3TCK]
MDLKALAVMQGRFIVSNQPMGRNIQIVH